MTQNQPRTTPRRFGKLRKLPSQKWQASFIGPDSRRHTAPETFNTKDAAIAWLNKQQRHLEDATLDGKPWAPPEPVVQVVAPPPVVLTFADMAETYMTDRNLKPRTAQEYRRYLDGWLIPTFGAMPMDSITPATVAKWHASIKAPSQRAHLYGLAHAIGQLAVDVETIDRNPFRIKSAMKVKRAVSTQLPADVDVAIAVAAMPDRYRLAVQLAAGLGLRSGEVRALQRGDFDLAETTGVLRIRRGVTEVTGQGIVAGLPKTAAGTRDLPLPAWLLPVVRHHLEHYTGPRDDDWLFTVPGTSRPLSHSTLWDHWNDARTVAGVPWCRFHNLRRYAATVASVKAGATMDEVRRMLGQDDIGVTKLYLDALQGRAEEIASKIPSLAVTTG